MPRKIVIDFFAGGGGASQGLCEAIGRPPDIAINHDAEALAMHKANHPKCRHVREDIAKVDLRGLVKRRKTGLAWFSPDCRDFSRAKGGKPVSKGVRSLAWIVVKVAVQLEPDVIILENVREFEEWGPLIPRWVCRGCDWKGTEGQVVHRRIRHHCPRCDSRRVSPTEDLVRDPKRKGLTFKKWSGRLRNLGYQLQWKTLDAADFGAPTHRKRLFLIARRDGKPIVWPAPTHADPKKLDRYSLFEQPAPHRTAAEIIDWELPCLSIFATPEEAKAWGKEHKRGTPRRPLKEKTLRRIALGIKRYVLDSPQPFIVKNYGGVVGHDLNRPLGTVTAVDHHGLVTPYVARIGQVGGNGKYTNSVEEPLTTIVSKPEHCLVTPYITPVTHSGERRSHGMEEPLPAVTGAHRGELGLVAPVLSKFHGQKSDESRCQAVDNPIDTVDTQNRYGLVAPTLMPHYGKSVAAQVDAPLGSVTAGGDGKQALVVPTLIQTGYGERDGQAPRVPGLDKPLGCVVDGQKHALVAACLNKFYGTTIGQPVDEPAPTQTAGGNHTGVTSAHLVKFRGDSDGQSIEKPLPTITSGEGAARPAGAAHALGLAAANLIRINHGEKQWNAIDEPLCTVTSQGNKFGLVYTFLTKYFGTAIGQRVDVPLGTQTQVDRYGLVKVEIEPGRFTDAVSVHVAGVGDCIIADIALRMLRPRELARAQGFPDSYLLSGPKFGKSTDSQVAKIGNSVPPIMAKVIALGNYAATHGRRKLEPWAV
jgi:DNA (cytosine-5)-methyltransferase 1